MSEFIIRRIDFCVGVFGLKPCYKRRIWLQLGVFVWLRLMDLLSASVDWYFPVVGASMSWLWRLAHLLSKVVPTVLLFGVMFPVCPVDVGEMLRWRFSDREDVWCLGDACPFLASAYNTCSSDEASTAFLWVFFLVWAILGFFDFSYRAIWQSSWASPYIFWFVGLLALIKIDF